MKSAQTPKTTHVRTCAVCGEKTLKRELLRIVRDGAGELHFDSTQKAPGRGAYVCSSACLYDVHSPQKLSRSFKMSVTEPHMKRVREEYERFIATTNN